MVGAPEPEVGSNHPEPGTTPPDISALRSALSSSVADTRERVFDQHIALIHNHNNHTEMKRASSVSLGTIFIVGLCEFV